MWDLSERDSPPSEGEKSSDWNSLSGSCWKGRTFVKYVFVFASTVFPQPEDRDAHVQIALVMTFQ